MPTLAAVARWARATASHCNIEIKPTPGRERETGAAVALDAVTLLDRLDQDRQHLPVEEAQGVGHHQQDQHVAPSAGAEGAHRRPRGGVDRRGGLDHRLFPQRN